MGGWIANILLSFDYQHDTHISVYLPLSTFQQKQGIQSTFEVSCVDVITYLGDVVVTLKQLRKRGTLVHIWEILSYHSIIRKHA